MIYVLVCVYIEIMVNQRVAMISAGYNMEPYESMLKSWR